MEKTSIPTNRILHTSPDNEIDYRKVVEFSNKMIMSQITLGHHGFPPILGIHDRVTQDDVGESFSAFTNYPEIITKDMIGMEIFRVSDGDHRVCSAQISGIETLETEPYIKTNR